jgi:hypothetical protein
MQKLGAGSLSDGKPTDAGIAGVLDQTPGLRAGRRLLRAYLAFLTLP